MPAGPQQRIVSPSSKRLLASHDVDPLALALSVLDASAPGSQQLPSHLGLGRQARDGMAAGVAVRCKKWALVPSVRNEHCSVESRQAISSCRQRQGSSTRWTRAATQLHDQALPRTLSRRLDEPPPRTTAHPRSANESVFANSTFALALSNTWILPTAPSAKSGPLAAAGRHHSVRPPKGCRP